MKLIGSRTEEAGRGSNITDSLSRGAGKAAYASNLTSYPPIAGASGQKPLAGNASIGDLLRSGGENIIRRNPTVTQIYGTNSQPTNKGNNNNLVNTDPNLV